MYNKSKRIKYEESVRPPFDINLRISAAFMYIGKGYAGIEQFFMFMNINSFTQSVFDAFVKSLAGSIDKVTQVMLNKFRSLVKENCKRNKDLVGESTTEVKEAEV